MAVHTIAPMKNNTTMKMKLQKKWELIQMT